MFAGKIKKIKLLHSVSAHMLSHADMHTQDIPTPCASPTHCMHFLATSHHKYPYAQEQFLLPSGNIQGLIWHTQTAYPWNSAFLTPLEPRR